MRRRRDPQRGTPPSERRQPDLFAFPLAEDRPGPAVWQALPEVTRRALRGLVARLLLEHGGRPRSAGGRGHDL